MIAYQELLVRAGLSENLAIVLENGTVILVTAGLALLADYVIRKIIVASITRIARKSKTHWDDIFVQRRVFNRLAHIAPALIVFYSLQYIFEAPRLVTFLGNVVQSYMVILILLVFDSVINALHEIYNTLPISKGRNIKGYVQVVKILLYFLALILVISIFSGKAPMTLIAGLGAVAAVLLLVFKDTILGFVASIQLSGNKMVSVGDWITMSRYGADGTVIDISLNTVKVQNWDKTISTIPTYAMVSESFSNWKGMEESGGRRIKRSVNIDMKSVSFLTGDQIEKFRKYYVLKDYINQKEKEIEAYNASLDLDMTTVTNGRRMTNLGTFRKYLENYLHNHPQIHDDMTFLVRHLQPTETGLPLEIYVFSKEQEWAKYEAVQADIFDHILAIMPEFDLRVFQNPTGDDFRKLGQAN
ncbi:MAG TPA: mechanosensitive ion channel [Bacteroides sp.]|nr:mechanosensitive ion channel [Bacteroides sp.]